jgi:hypothetical protein
MENKIMNNYDEADYGKMYEPIEPSPYIGECRELDDCEYEFTEEGYWISVE